ncbi:myosin light chain kinase, smooth muscle [Manacus vitellinus]|uniref:myosin light chain kinase, smooth muscle n=1 Tax=Manacus vitellinus TaxID=328815 RepID=UPI00115C643E|nr:myosin light chain kinase, smooth muscle [Manacus vitellinus]
MSQAGGAEETFEHRDVVINTQDKVSDVYTQLEKLGEGKFGKVYRLREKASGKIRAGKYFRTRTGKERAAARAEVELMNLLQHPRLVQCLAAFQGPTELVMVMEYVAGGELFERIVDDDFEHTEPSSAQYVRQILEGLQFMHGRAIKTGKALLALNRLTLLSQSLERKVSEAQDEEGSNPGPPTAG